MKKITYDTYKFQFKKELEKIFDINNFEKAHQFQDDKDKPVVTRETDQKTDFHKMYYSNLNGFLSVYEDFINKEIKPIFGEDIVYQAIPTFRIQYPNNKGVGEFHRDRDYNHNPEEINFFLPFTDAIDTSTIWIETEEGKEDFYPLNALYGDVVIFKGINLKHGNKINETGKTRISVDFRVIPLSKYKEQEGKSSINTKVEFKIGGYYNVTSS